MDTRATIETLLDKAYDARRRQDADAAAACFTEDGCFMANGGRGTKSRAEQVTALKAMFDSLICSGSASIAALSTRRMRWCIGAARSARKTARSAIPTCST